MGGLLLRAGGATSGVAAVNVCDTLIKLAAGRLVDVACGSLVLGVIVGPVDVLNSGETTTLSVASDTTVTISETTDGDLLVQLGDTILVTMPPDSSATVAATDETQFLIESSPNSTNTVLVQIEDQVLALEPGEPPMALTTDLAQDDDGDLVPNAQDACPSAPGLIKRQGCLVGDLNTVELHIIDQRGIGVCGTGGSCKLLVGDAEVRVFDRNAPDFQATYGTKNPSGAIYDMVFENDIGRVGTCTTAPNGSCIAGEEAIGDYLVIVKYADSETGKIVYSGRSKSPGDFIDTDGDNLGDLATKEFQIIKVYRNKLDRDGNPIIQLGQGNKTVVTGSYLEIVGLEYAIWDEGIANYVYPFIFTSDSDWTLDVCAEVPVGYQIVGVFDENGELISNSRCAQTIVANETTV